MKSTPEVALVAQHPGRLRQVKTIDRLLGLSGKAVWVASWGKPCSVAFLISMRVITLQRFIKTGIYEYKAGK